MSTSCRHCHEQPDEHGLCCRHSYEDEQACEALEASDLPDATIEALAAEAAWEARCLSFEWRMALGLAGGDAWVCERLGLAMGVAE
jgi:hypothetical protein